MKSNIYVLVLLFAFGGACSQPPERNLVQRDGKAEVIQVSSSDAAINEAIRNARLTVQDFTTTLKAPKPTQSDFTVKYPFQESDITEHMWVVDLKYDGKVFTGILNNYPKDMKTFTYQQTVELVPSQISDWMYKDNGRLIGAYTIRALYKDFPEDKRREIEESLGATIDW